MYKLRLTQFVFKCLKGYTVTEFKGLFLQGNSGRRRNMRISFFQDQKQILSRTPYALEEQLHGTLKRTRKQGPKPLKNLIPFL